MSRAALALPVLGLLCLAHPASAQAPAGPAAALPRLDSAARDSVALVSRAQLGARYRYGAHQPATGSTAPAWSST